MLNSWRLRAQPLCLWQLQCTVSRQARRFCQSQEDQHKQQRLANLGKCVDELNKAIPLLLDKSLPADLIHPNIKLEVFPETHPGFYVTGATAYKTTVKLIQLAVTTLMVPRTTQLQILSVHVDKSLGDIEDSHIFVNWRSVSPDRSRMLAVERNINHIWEPGRLIQSLGVLLPDEYPVLAGSFEFGLTPECDHVLRHVIRNVEYMSRPDSQLLVA